MNEHLISKRTRNEFRESLVGWYLRDIELAFEEAGLSPNQDYTPRTSGQRRSLVEQIYSTIDFSDPTHVRKAVKAFSAILRLAATRNPGSLDPHVLKTQIAALRACLEADGYAFSDGKLTSSSPRTACVFEEQPEVTRMTRQFIFDSLSAARLHWSGRESETVFLGRLFDLGNLPSTDPRYHTMQEDVRQHCEINDDWDANWILTDIRINLLAVSDSTFLRFLCEMAHPMVRPMIEEAKRTIGICNEHLVTDGWELVEGRMLSGRPTFVPRRIGLHAVPLTSVPHAADVLSMEYVRELSGKCDDRMARGDYDGAVTVARTLVEAVLGELEHKISGSKQDYKGELPKQFKAVAKLLQMDTERVDLDERFKDVIRGLVVAINGIAPLRNKLSDGHARVRAPAPHHARLVVNSGRTVAGFLVESFLYQAERGTLGLHHSASKGDS